MIIIRQMRSALIEIDEALLRLSFLWWLGFAAGRRNQAATKTRKKKKIKKKKKKEGPPKQNKTKQKQKQKHKMVKKKKRKTQSIKQSKAEQSRAEPNFVCSLLLLYVCLSVCVSVSLCVFCQVLSLRARAMGA